MTNHRKAGKMFMWCFGLMIITIIISVLMGIYGNARLWEQFGLIIAITGLSSLIFGFYGGLLLSREDIKVV
jgi:VIT1/CCC1 family predicted Fe2+/Mn2+ transporter